MALPWHIPLEAISHLKKKEVASKPSLLEHYCNLDIHINPCDELQTGLMCEIGLNNREPGIIQRLIASGMTVARLSLRDLDPGTRTQLVQSIRQAVSNYSTELDYVYPLAVIIDVRGPDIVTGDLKGGPRSTIELICNETIKLTTDASWRECGTADCLYIGYDHITDLMPYDNIFIDSLSAGQIKLEITEVGDDSVDCKIINGGIIGAKMMVRIYKVPQVLDKKTSDRDSSDSIIKRENSAQPFEYVEEQISWAVASDIDGLIIPNVHDIQDVRHARDILSDKGKHILVFASIDSIIALDNIDMILAEADGIYVDRFVLGNDLPVEKIFMAQKVIIAKCNEKGKPCIFKAVINEQIPTLCITDVANLVLDGTDVLALELHFDSPLKKFAPTYDEVRMAEHCLAAAAVICRHAERTFWQPNNLKLVGGFLEDPSKTICLSAVELATRSRATVIICLTCSGRTAKILSQFKPTCPIIAVTRACHTARQLRFWKGVRAVHYFEAARGSWVSEVESRVHTALDYCKVKRVLRAGDPYVLVTGSRRGVGYCDCLRLLYASARETVYVE